MNTPENLTCWQCSMKYWNEAAACPACGYIDGDDPHQRIDEAEHHAADCQCSICYYGPEIWLHRFHPSEY